MADSEDEFACAGNGFYESLTQESTVETPQKKRDYAKFVEEGVSIWWKARAACHFEIWKNIKTIAGEIYAE